MEPWLREHQVIVDRHNRRLKVMNCLPAKLNELAEKLPSLARQEQATKITIYAKKEEVDFFRSLRYVEEGSITGFFAGKNAYLLSVFPDPKRGHSSKPREADEILKLSLGQPMVERRMLADSLILRPAHSGDAEELANLFLAVFPQYPTPVYDPAYIKLVMDSHVDFMLIEEHGKMISVASADITYENRCAELTDCATLPAYRGQSLLSHLFFALEDHLQKKNIDYLFTLTRAISPAMNITAARHGYRYQGRLINNCIISTGFEDMNIWVKPLKEVSD